MNRRITFEDRGYTSPCWIWKGAISDTGYGNVEIDGKAHNVHRLMYRLFMGAPNPSLSLDHLCCVPACCNPSHLEEVTHRENLRRALKDHCKHGHPLTPDNLVYVSTRPTYRICKTCHRRRDAERKSPAKRHTGSCAICGGSCLPTSARCKTCQVAGRTIGDAS